MCPPSLRQLSALLVLGLLLAVAGCGGPPVHMVPREARERSVDPAVALAKINAYRSEHGLSALTLDPMLTAVARTTAQELARRDQLKTEMHTVAGLEQRLHQAGFQEAAAAENLGAGYPTLDTAIAGWKASPGHNRNLLNPLVTRMGIGLALAGRGRFVSYWVLILARPADQGAAS